MGNWDLESIGIFLKYTLPLIKDSYAKFHVCRLFSIRNVCFS